MRRWAMCAPDAPRGSFLDPPAPPAEAGFSSFEARSDAYVAQANAATPRPRLVADVASASLRGRADLVFADVSLEQYTAELDDEAEDYALGDQEEDIQRQLVTSTLRNPPKPKPPPRPPPPPTEAMLWRQATQAAVNAHWMRALRRQGTATPEKLASALSEMSLAERERLLAMEPPFVEAIERFDAANKARHDVALFAHHALKVDLTSRAKHVAFSRVLAEVMRLRFVAPERELQTTFEGIVSSRAAAAHVVGGSEWSLPISNWKARPKFADSGDFYDDATTLRRAFDVDWSLAVRSHDLAGYIMRHDDGESDDDEGSAKNRKKKGDGGDAEGAKDEGAKEERAKEQDAGAAVNHDRDGDAMEDDEVTEAALVLHGYASLIYSVFDCYASMLSPSGSIDITRISSNAYRRFLKDTKMAVPGSKVASSANFDQIFVLVNAKDEGPRPQAAGEAAVTSVGGAHGGAADVAGEDEDTRALSRQEFLQV